MMLLQLHTPTTGGEGTYRHDHDRSRSLNFEARGGESHSPDDVASESLSQIYHLLARAAKSTTTAAK
jgi:hypothetical protein